MPTISVSLNSLFAIVRIFDVCDMQIENSVMRVNVGLLSDNKQVKFSL